MMMEGRRRAADDLGLSSPADIDYSLEDREYLDTGLGLGYRGLACVFAIYILLYDSYTCACALTGQ